MFGFTIGPTHFKEFQTTRGKESGLLRQRKIIRLTNKVMRVTNTTFPHLSKSEISTYVVETVSLIAIFWPAMLVKGPLVE